MDVLNEQVNRRIHQSRLSEYRNLFPGLVYFVIRVGMILRPGQGWDALVYFAILPFDWTGN